jgi:hypothetical protein
VDTVAVALLLILVLGWAAFLFATLLVLGRIVGGIGRGLTSLLKPGRCGGSGRRLYSGRVGKVCPNPHCRKLEYREAVYCSQCGTRFNETSGSDGR